MLLQSADLRLGNIDILRHFNLGLSLGSLTPKIPESLIWLIFLRKFKFLVDRTAVLCYNTIIVQEGSVVYEIKN